MADVEWIKLQVDMFNNRKIKRLRKLPEGNNIVLIWIMLLSLAGACNAGGLIFLTDTIPYDRESLADEFGFEPAQIGMALDALAAFGMVVFDDRELRIRNWEEYQNVEGLEKIREQNRLRKARFDQKKREMLPGNVTVTQSNAADIEKDTDKNKNEDTEGDIETEREVPPQADIDLSDFSPIVQEALQRYFQHRKELKKTYKPTGLEAFLNSVRKNVQQYGDVKVCRCIDLTIENGWTGVFWEKLENGKSGKPEKTTNNIFLEMLDEERRKNGDEAGNDADSFYHQGELVFDI